ncbi:MAG: ThuA domain-containing protein [Verrucomicrobiota bacterium JB023]|nr:ThuA domain-containing protein [Verrucomicrobiota bacterium JB023]
MSINRIIPLLISCLLVTGTFAGAMTHLVFEPPGEGNGKHVVLISGDEEYRTEESFPMLGKILSQHHGFKATVLFALDPEEGYIDSNNQKNIPGTEALDEADLMIIGTRFRQLPDEQLKPILAYLNAGKPVIGTRTATHAFTGKSKFGGFTWREFGPRILGEGWVNHHGRHKKEGCRAVNVEANSDHPVLNNVEEIFCKTDVYGIKRINKDNATILQRGIVTNSLQPDSKPVKGKNSPPMPLTWLRVYKTPNGEGEGKAFCTTMGSSQDFLNEDLRRLIVNAAYFLTGSEVPEKADVTLVDDYPTSPYGFHRGKGFYKNRNLKPADFVLGQSAATAAKPAEKPAEKVSSTLPLAEPAKGETIVFVGNGLGDGFQRNGTFETLVQMNFPEKEVVVRNLCHPGFTPGFRPHPSRASQWAFPGAEEFRPQNKIHRGKGHYPTEDEWLTTLGADTILGFFGFNESFDGEDGLAAFEGELNAFITHTLKQKYNGKTAPRLVLVSPFATESWIDNAEETLARVELYANAMEKVAKERKVGFVDFFDKPSVETNNGVIPTESSYQALAKKLVTSLYGEESKVATDSDRFEAVREAVLEKNWFWMNDYRMPNGVHVYGRRYKPYGNVNYPDEIKKNREMTENRDQAIWAAVQGESFDLAAADAKTTKLGPIETNYKPSKKNGTKEYLYGQDALDSLEIADGFRIELFASEKEFDNLANPVQMSFDDKGRLWVATMPSYPHYRPGDQLPEDKILIYEDTDGDGKADKETVFAGNLSLPMGFEIAPEGVYVSQAPHLVLLKDTDGDDKADEREIVMTGFDHHDTHHAISAFTADPMGSVVMCEGVFLHTNVETMNGPVRGVDGGFYRYDPKTKRLERSIQMSIPNPWGYVFDKYGQDFFLHTSGTRLNWATPMSLRTRYGEKTPGTKDLVPEAERVRPTSGIEIVSSRNFPDEMQGDILLCNNIGFLGIKQHEVVDDGTGFELKFRQNLLVSKDGNFRPVDLEFAPDGSLYVVDWHNVLIGHMQHSARDPLRDHAHGRIYRITYENRSLVKPATVEGAPIASLLDLLKEPEARTRYRVRRELRGRDADEVTAALAKWLPQQKDDHARLEGLWVSAGVSQVNVPLLKELLASDDFRIRAAAVRVLRYQRENVSDSADLFVEAAKDEHGRVRLEALVSATWVKPSVGKRILVAAEPFGTDSWSEGPWKAANNLLDGVSIDESGDEPKARVPKHVARKDRAKYLAGHEIYHRDGFCVTCHQADGKGLPSAGFPPLAATDWVTGDPERVVKITLHGLMGPITVNGVDYPGQVPMTPFGGMLNDEEIASVVTYVRNSFGNKADAIDADMVKKVREETKGKVGFWSPEELKN